MKEFALTIQNTPFPAPSGVPTGKTDSIESVMQLGITFLFIAVVVLTLVFLVWGGIQWILSGGDKTKLEAARNRLLYGIIGLIIAFSAFFIVRIIGDIFGVPLI